MPELRWHLDRFVEDGPRGVVFIGPLGGRLKQSNFRKIWNKDAGTGGDDQPEGRDYGA